MAEVFWNTRAEQSAGHHATPFNAELFGDDRRRELHMPGDSDRASDSDRQLGKNKFAQNSQIGRISQIGKNSHIDNFLAWQAGPGAHLSDAGIGRFAQIAQESQYAIERTQFVQIGRGQRAGNIAPERQALEAEARAKISKNKELSRLLDDMTTFERRARATGLTDKQINDTFAHTTRILAAPNATLSLDQRIKVAEQIIRNAAKPTSIDQGRHGTCNVAVVETRLYTRNPEAAAKLVADVATTGSFRSHDGSVITPTARSLHPDDEAGGNPPSDGQRGLASQIFQITAANVHWQRMQVTPDGKLSRRGSIIYEQIESKRSWFTGDTGERVMDYNVDPPRETTKYRQGPALSVSDLIGIANQITGKTESGFVIENEVHGGRGTVHVTSPRELEQAILDAGRNGQFPAFIRVHTGNDPFLSDSGGSFARQRGVWHVVSITGYDARTKKVSVDNQWGGRGDRSIDLEKLYKATLEPGTPEWKRKHEFFILPGFGDVEIDPDTRAAVDPNDRSYIPRF